MYTNTCIRNYTDLYMHTSLSHVHLPLSLSFMQRIREVGEKLGIQPLVIQGKELEEKGFGGT